MVVDPDPNPNPDLLTNVCCVSQFEILGHLADTFVQSDLQ